MRDPDQYGPRHVTAFSITLQHFLTVAKTFSEITLRVASYSALFEIKYPVSFGYDSRSGALRRRDKLEDPFHNELRRNRRQQQT